MIFSIQVFSFLDCLNDDELNIVSALRDQTVLRGVVALCGVDNRVIQQPQTQSVSFDYTCLNVRLKGTVL